MDKATMDMEYPSDGYLAKILVPAGSKDLPLGKIPPHTHTHTPSHPPAALHHS